VFRRPAHSVWDPGPPASQGEAAKWGAPLVITVSREPFDSVNPRPDHIKSAPGLSLLSFSEVLSFCLHSR
jgi:hypothetical protein